MADLLPIPNLSKLAFGQVELHRYCTELKDTFGPRWATHKIPGRTGIKQEELGGEALRTQVHLEFAGAEWRGQVDLLGKLVKKPRDTLVHPVYGRKRMVLKHPVQGAMDFARKGANYSVDLLFEEDALDQDLLPEGGPATQSQRTKEQAGLATAAGTAMNTLILAKYRVGALAREVRGKMNEALSLIAAFTDPAEIYAGAALIQFSQGILDSSLGVQVARLPQLGDDAIKKIRTVTPDHSANERMGYDVISAIELTVKAAQDLDRSIRANLPVPVVIKVQQKTSLGVFVQGFYQDKTLSQRKALEEQIEAINRLRRWDIIYPGTSLTVPVDSPTSGGGQGGQSIALGQPGLDVTRERNGETGQYRLVMSAGDPVMADDLSNEILELLSEDEWGVQETKRRGNLHAQFSEATSGIRDRLKIAVEDHLQPLIDDDKATEVRCTSVSRPAQTVTFFTVEVDRPGKQPTSLMVASGGRA